MTTATTGRTQSLMQSESVLQPLGRALVTAFYAAAQALKLYPLENATVQKALDELHRIARRIVEREGALQLKLIGDLLFLNDARLRLDLSDYMAFSYMAGLLRKHNIGSVEVEQDVTRDNWAPFVALLLADAPPAIDYVFEQFLQRLSASPADHIQVGEAKDTELDKKEVEPD